MGNSYPSADMQLVYSEAKANWASCVKGEISPHGSKWAMFEIRNSTCLE